MYAATKIANVNRIPIDNKPVHAPIKRTGTTKIIEAVVEPEYLNRITMKAIAITPSTIPLAILYEIENQLLNAVIPRSVADPRVPLTDCPAPSAPVAV